MNDIRKRKSYSDETAAMTVNSTKLKPTLTATPFVRELEYGKNCKRYWNYDQMVLPFGLFWVVF